MNDAVTATVVIFVILIVVAAVVVALYFLGYFNPPQTSLQNTIDPNILKTSYNLNSPWQTATPVDDNTGFCNVYTFLTDQQFGPAAFSFNSLQTCVGVNCQMNTNQQSCIDSDQLFAIHVTHTCLGNESYQTADGKTVQGASITSGMCLQQNGLLVPKGTVENFYQHCNPPNTAVTSAVTATGTNQTNTNTNGFACPGSLSIIAFNVTQGALGPNVFSDAVCMVAPTFTSTVIATPVVTPPDITPTPTPTDTSTDNTGTSGVLDVHGSLTTPTTTTIKSTVPGEQPTTYTITGVFSQAPCNMASSYGGYPNQLFRVEFATYKQGKFVPDNNGMFAKITHRPTGLQMIPTDSVNLLGSTLTLGPVSGYNWIFLPKTPAPASFNARPYTVPPVLPPTSKVINSNYFIPSENFDFLTPPVFPPTAVTIPTNINNMNTPLSSANGSIALTGLSPIYTAFPGTIPQANPVIPLIAVYESIIPSTSFTFASQRITIPNEPVSPEIITQTSIMPKNISVSYTSFINPQNFFPIVALYPSVVDVPAPYTIVALYPSVVDVPAPYTIVNPNNPYSPQNGLSGTGITIGVNTKGNYAEEIPVFSSVSQIVYIGDINTVPDMTDPLAMWTFLTSSYSVHVNTTDQSPQKSGNLFLGSFIYYDQNVLSSQNPNSAQYYNYAILPFILTNPSNFLF